jgi:hypothetical protein
MLACLEMLSRAVSAQLTNPLKSITAELLRKGFSCCRCARGISLRRRGADRIPVAGRWQRHHGEHDPSGEGLLCFKVSKLALGCSAHNMKERGKRREH